MNRKCLPLVAALLFAAGIGQNVKAQSFEEFVKQQNAEFEEFAKERQQGIEALRAEYEQTVEDYKRAMNRMYDSEISSIDLMKSDDNIEITSKAKAPKTTINSKELSDNAIKEKEIIANTSSSELMKQLTGTDTENATSQQVKEATNKLASIISDVINQTESANAQPKEEPKKEQPKVEPKPEEKQKAEPKKEEKKAEPKQETKKAEPKKEEKKTEPKQETKKATDTGAGPNGKPCTYSRISSPFGERIHPVYGKKSFHKGVDLASPNGTPIYATADGIVAFAGVCNGYGNFIKLNHQNGYKTGYAHMSKMVVKTNDKVKKGDLIGYVGSTGTSTGNHLHYEVYYKDQLTDPAKTL